MTPRVIVDTGPFGGTAQPNRQDTNHARVVQQLRGIQPPKATYLTRAVPGARAARIEMLGDGFLSIGVALAEHHRSILAVVRRYTDVPMSLADACLVWLAELYPQSPVLTLDSDFGIYRKNGRQVIEAIRP